MLSYMFATLLHLLMDLDVAALDVAALDVVVV